MLGERARVLICWVRDVSVDYVVFVAMVCLLTLLVAIVCWFAVCLTVT